MKDGKMTLLAFCGALCATAFGEAARVEVDATRPGPKIPNTSQVLTVWNGLTTDWSLPDNPSYPTRGFVRYVEMMSCTGGNAERDLFLNPADRTVLDDYDFTRLLDACRGILSHGAKPYLKLGNVPVKFTADYDGGEFRMNIRPPTDHLVHYRYMKACAAALKAAFGRDEVRTWRFAVLTEADNIGWFRAKSKDKAEIREEFFKLYDFAAKAFEEELGGGLAFGTHLLYPGDACISQFTIGDVIAHCATGTNAATGKVGAPLGLLTISYYGHPDKDDLTQGRMRGLKEAVDRAHAAGFTGLVTGVDEGRVIFGTPGKDRKDICSRAVGASYEAAFDLRVVRGVLDAGADYFATWGHFSGPCSSSEGLPSHHYFSCREFARFEGMRRAEASVMGTAPPHEELDALAGVSEDGTDVRIAVGRFRDRLVFTNRLETAVSVRLPKAFAGRTVDVSVLTLDDRNNWFVDWERDRAKNGIGAQDFSWSPDDFAVLERRVLTTPRFRTLFAEKLQPAYARKAASAKPVVRRLQAGSDGLLTLPLDFVGNGLAFVSLHYDPLETIPALKPLPQSEKPGGWQTRLKKKAELVRQGGAKCVFLGDSITEGWETTGKNVWRRYFDGPDAPYPSLNLGYCGDRTENLLWRIENGELDGYEAKLIFLMIGTNNSYARWEKETVVETICAIRRILRKIRERQPKATVVLHPIFPRGHDPKDVGRAYNDAVNAELRLLADGRHVLWCDFTRQFLRPDGTLPFEIMPDELHPSALGYEIWASAILPYFEGSRAQRFPETLAADAFPGDGLPRTMVPFSRVEQDWWLDKIIRNRARIWGGEREYDLVMTGDSITHYWEIGEGEDDSREIEELERRYRHMNCGYGGEWTQNLLWRLKSGELDGCKVKVLAIQIGTNNFFWPTKPDEVARAILEAVRVFRERHPEAKVLLTSCFPRSAGRAPLLEKVNDRLAKSADGKDIFWLDIYDRFLHPDGKLRKELFTDGLHPSAAGYRVWLDALVPVVDKLLHRQ